MRPCGPVSFALGLVLALALASVLGLALATGFAICAFSLLVVSSLCDPRCADCARFHVFEAYRQHRVRKATTKMIQINY